MVKGAESALLDRSRNNNGEQIEKHVIDYAKVIYVIKHTHGHESKRLNASLAIVQD